MPHQILVADHDPLVRKGLDEFLHRSLGYAVTCVPCGDAAVDAAMKQRFDLYILGIDGPDEAEASMRLHSLHPDLQAIFLTTNGEQEAVKDFLRFSMPADRVLIKPLHDLTNLTKLIVGILGPPIN